MVLTTMLRNLKETGYPLSMRQWGLFTKNIYEMAIIDLIMVASTGISMPLNKVFKNSKGWLQWRHQGMNVQIIFQACWLLLWVSWPFVRDWTWTAQVFFTLHLLVMFMKMHSYAFYNGHLANTLQRLSALDNPAADASTAAAVKYPSSKTPIADINDELKEEETAQADSLTQLREDLAMELVSPFGRLTYPQNLTVANYFDFLLCPTLCYELEYPRTGSRSYLEIFWKSLAVCGIIFLLTITSEEFIIPVLAESAERLEHQHNWHEGSLVFAETVSRLLFPFMVAFLLVFLVIFEYLLGAFAEITCKSETFYCWREAFSDLPQASPTGSSIRTGGTVSIGLSSLANGTFRSIISSVAMSTRRLATPCPVPWPPSSPSWFLV
jgi:sterol O-acyltransferase